MLQQRLLTSTLSTLNIGSSTRVLNPGLGRATAGARGGIQ